MQVGMRIGMRIESEISMHTEVFIERVGVTLFFVAPVAQVNTGPALRPTESWPALR